MTEFPDLEGILDELKAELPANVRKTLKAAIDNGWEIKKPGMTIALRLDHPTMVDAYPVYVSWTLGRTPTGKISFKHDSAGTKSGVPLSGADLLVYLEDPVTATYNRGPLECEFHLCDEKDPNAKGRDKPPAPVYLWIGGGRYCEKHAKIALPEIEFKKGHYARPTDYNPDDPSPWDEEKDPSENLTAQLGGTVILDIGHSGARKPAQPLRVKAPPPKSPRSS